ncbi:PREDICTED: uncharacterized protein LOC108769691 [Trachymyrmex cornetzi]|uniref:uncharacterized protein LOC108769691 n=1 Tax=Trachymyrmex cornetzi TaxID=471704 RepID=UPI00084F08B3|nr:PREDICTED: uncharacterized protein LOC108769691 [Trachymyrmex cornetzi]
MVAITANTSAVELVGKMPTSARGEAPLPRRGRSGATRYPRETRIRVVEGEIVNSPIAESISAGTPAFSGSGGGAEVGEVSSNASSVIAVETEREESIGGDSTPSTSIEESEDLSSSFDQIPKKGKKRGRKPKGSNCPGAHALSKLSSKRMDYEDDELDRVDFFKISKRAGHGLKKRKGLVGCQLDDRLSSRQKDAIEEVTALFPQMSPKSVMAETLRVLETAGEAERRTQTMKGDLRRQIKLGVNVAKIAVQRLVSEISKGTGPTNEVRANNLALEREVIKLRREVDTLRREREMMREQINALQCTVQDLKDRIGNESPPPPPSDEEARDAGSPIRTRERTREERTVRGRDNDIDEAESLPPAYRPPIGGVRRRLEDRPPRPTRVNEMGDIVMGDTGRSTLYKRGDAYAERTRNGPMGNNDGAGLGDDRDLESSPPPMDYPASGEAWTEARTKRARKRMRKKEKARAAPDASAEVRDGRDPRRVVVPLPSVGGSTAGVRRAGTAKSATGASARGGAPRGPASASAVIRLRVKDSGDAVRWPPPAKDNRFGAPRTAAVLIKCAENKDRPGGVTYAEVMKLARSKISLDDLSITNTRIRKAQAGGLLIEIPGGEETGAKAEALVDKLKGVIAENEYKEEVNVVRPMRRAEMRLVDIDQSVTAEEVAEAVARNGLARLEDVRRRLQCFRCFAVGHTRANCLSQVDRSTWCFQCGSSDGHKAAGCGKPPKCPMCAGRGLPSGHRAGAAECVPFNGRGQAPNGGDTRVNMEEISTGAVRGAPTLADEPDRMEVVDGYLSEEEFSRNLYELENKLLGIRGYPVVIAGDFNARAHAWDPGRPNRRGAILVDWIDIMGQVLNDGVEPTCVHPRGVSCVDLTLASPSAARRISSWKVETDLESLSDHKYVSMKVGTSLIGPTTGRMALRAFPRWAVGRADSDMMEAAAVFTAWSATFGNATSVAEKMDRALRDISDASMPRRGFARKPSTYWWNEEIADLRRSCNGCRRRLTRARTRNGVLPADIQVYWDELREARRRLRGAISRSKARLWGELVNDLERDPWGMPYRLVLKKLHASGASVVEVLPPEIVGEIVTTLFPADNTPQVIGTLVDWRDEMAVTPVEVLEAGTKIKLDKAPGPDGITGHVIKKTMENLAPVWARCFTECFRRGHFPRQWKLAKPVLVKKPGKPDLSPSSYRPLCLLSEAGKLLERVIVRRLQTFLDDIEGIANGQYGFRRHRSTIDAVWCLRERVGQGIRDGGVVVAVSLDIANAFNSLPWPVIRRALGEKGVPEYLRNILHDYLSDRGLSYVDRRDRLVRETMTRGVPQGSVLGPTLLLNTVLCGRHAADRECCDIRRGAYQSRIGGYLCDKTDRAAGTESFGL